MPDGGKLTIETRQRRSRRRLCRHAQRRDGRANMCWSPSATPAPACRADVIEQGLRAVLHHQANRQGHRPRPQHGLRLRQAVRRPHQDLQRGGPRHHRQALPAAQRRDESAAAIEPAPAERLRAAAKSFLWSRTTNSCATTWSRRSRASATARCRRTGPVEALDIIAATPDRPAVHRCDHAGLDERARLVTEALKLRRDSACSTRPATPRMQSFTTAGSIPVSCCLPSLIARPTLLGCCGKH